MFGKKQYVVRQVRGAADSFSSDETRITVTGRMLSGGVRLLPRPSPRLPPRHALLSTSPARHSRETFVRDRENINLVTVGASQHGKTFLSARLSQALAGAGVPPKQVTDIDHSATERQHGRSEVG